MPTTRSSHRNQPSKSATGGSRKRASDNSSITNPAKREKVSTTEQRDRKESDMTEVKGAGTEESEQASSDIAEGKKSAAKNSEKEAETPSSTLEKGIIYFFYRGRVGVEDSQGIRDVARSYIVLRPLDIRAKGSDGPLDDAGNSRLLALPKKMLPKKHGDGFLAFVEKAACSIKDLREQFSDSQYATKTAGTRHIPAATPVAEGVYSITSSDGRSHLTYQIKLPEIGEVQDELGVHEKGRYVVFVKNPEYPGPGGGAPLGDPPAYSESTQKKFKGLRWIPLIPEFLDYGGTQLLVIEESLNPLEKPVEGVSEYEKDDLETTTVGDADERETQTHRCAPHHAQSDSVFTDLKMISKDYQKMQTTW